MKRTVVADLSTRDLQRYGRQIYREIEPIYDRFDCGRSLVRYLLPDVGQKEARLQAILAELKHRSLLK